MKWIGLTGGIATGKSTVARLVESLGASVIDADKISHQLTRIGQSGYKQVVSYFGTSILNDSQEIDRKVLAQIIFSDVQKKNNLEKILHPLIQDEVLRLKIEYKNNQARFCFYDVPLLFEKKMENNFDSVVTVWCDEKTQISRLRTRNNLTVPEALARIETQIPLADKILKSQYCIDNSGPEESLIQIVSNWFENL